MSSIKSVVYGSTPSAEQTNDASQQDQRIKAQKTKAVFDGARTNPSPDDVVVVLVSETPSDGQRIDADTSIPVELEPKPPTQGESSGLSESGTIPADKSTESKSKPANSNPSDKPVDILPTDAHDGKFPYNPKARAVSDGIGGAINAQRSAKVTIEAIKASGKDIQIREISPKTASTLFAGKQVNNIAWGAVNAMLIPKAKEVVRLVIGDDAPEYQVSSTAGFISGAATTILFIPTTLIFSKCTTEDIPVQKSVIEFLKTLKHNPAGTLKICYASKTALHQIASSGLFGAVFVAVNDLTYSELMKMANEYDPDGNYSSIQKAMVCGGISTGVAGLTAIGATSYFDMQAKVCAHESNEKLKAQKAKGQPALTTEAPKEPIPKTGTAIETVAQQGSKVVEKTVSKELSTLARYGKHVFNSTKLWLPFMIFTGIISPVFHAWERGDLHMPTIGRPVEEDIDNEALLGEITLKGEKMPSDEASSSSRPSLKDSIDRLQLGNDGEWTLGSGDDDDTSVDDEASGNSGSSLRDSIDRLQLGNDGEWTLGSGDNDTSVDDDTRSIISEEESTPASAELSDTSKETEALKEDMGFGGY